MSRIRSIKPAFWTSEQVLECSRNARLLFIGLWNFCDDFGRHPYSAKQAKAEVFPGDDIPLAEIDGLLAELLTVDLIRAYDVDGKRYFYVTGWEHQRIDKPQPARYPEPIPEHSKKVRRTIPPDRIGKDRKDRIDTGANAPSAEFDKFKSKYPSRGSASQPWKPARDQFEKHVKAGVEPEEIIVAAEIYAQHCEQQKIAGTEKVAQALTWLRQERFRDYFAGIEAELSRRKKADEDMAAKGYVWKDDKWQKMEAA